MLLDHLTDAASSDMAASNNFVSAPAFTLPPSQPDQYFTSTHNAGSMMNGPTLGGNAFPLTPGASSLPTPGSVAGRKRSRGDIFANDEEQQPDGSLPTPASETGSLPNSDSTMAFQQQVNATNSFTQANGHDQTTRQPFQLHSAARPIMPSRKSQRMGASSSQESNDFAQLVLPNMRDVTSEPLIDEATRRLGISWTRMDSREALQINQAAYAKFITNHYPALREVKVWFENSAIPGYLVQSLNVYNGEREYYIFSQDLTEARLVTRDATDLVARLQLLPALHLAAPGGCIRAQMDSMDAAQEAKQRMVQDEMKASTFASEPSGTCAAHSMELD